jgi:hypothetical protein
MKSDQTSSRKSQMRNWSRNIAVLAGAVTLTAIVAAACASEAASTPESTATPRALPTSTVNATSGRIFLIAPVGTYQEGWADLTETPDGLRVALDVEPGGALAQPAHIHLGDCDQLGDIAHTLENVIGGKSVSVFAGVMIEDVATGGMAINIHRSFSDFPTYTACGVIPALP